GGVHGADASFGGTALYCFTALARTARRQVIDPNGCAPGGEFLAVGGRQRKRRRDHWDARVALRKGFIFESWSGSDRRGAPVRGGAARAPYESRTHAGCAGTHRHPHSTNSHNDRL